MYVNSLTWGKSALRLYPLSDVHWPKHEVRRLTEWRDMVKADKNAIVTLGGDMFDFARTHARSHMRAYTADSNSFEPIDHMAQAWVNDFADFLKPIAGKVVGACSGNHYHPFPDGQTSDQKLALALSPDSWVGVGGIVVVEMGGYKLKTLLHHDAGRSGATPGADFNAFLRAAQNVDVDIIVLGHTHRLMNLPGSTRVSIDDTDNTITAHQTIFVRSGSYMRRYSEEKKKPRTAPHQPDYGEEKLYAPSTFGHAVVEVTIKKGAPRYSLRTEIR